MPREEEVRMVFADVDKLKLEELFSKPSYSWNSWSTLRVFRFDWWFPVLTS